MQSCCPTLKSPGALEKADFESPSGGRGFFQRWLSPPAPVYSPAGKAPRLCPGDCAAGGIMLRKSRFEGDLKADQRPQLLVPGGFGSVRHRSNWNGTAALSDKGWKVPGLSRSLEFCPAPGVQEKPVQLTPSARNLHLRVKERGTFRKGPRTREGGGPVPQGVTRDTRGLHRPPARRGAVPPLPGGELGAVGAMLEG